MCEEAERRENETISELQQTIVEMRAIILEKEQAIQQLEKVKPIVEEDTFITKYREVNFFLM